MTPPHHPRCDPAGGSGGDRSRRVLDSALGALADERRRRVVYELRENHGVLETEELAGLLADAFDADRDSVHTKLYHADLPRLAECGIVDYDSDEGQVHYTAGSTVTDLVGTIAEYE